MTIKVDLLLLALPLLWIKDFKSGSCSKHITMLQAVMSMPSSQTLVTMIEFFVQFRRPFNVSYWVIH